MSEPFDVVGIENQWRQIRIREVTIIVALFLRSCRPHGSVCRVPEHRFLANGFPAIQHRTLTLELALQRSLNCRERIHVLDFGLGSELRDAVQTSADVRINAQASLL